MGYPFKYNFSASTGFFHITSSSNGIYFKFEVVDFHKPIPDVEDEESGTSEELSAQETRIPKNSD